jgi:hypothetical protein
MKTKEERMKRIVARGEVSGHSHIVTGECTVELIDNKTIIKTKTGCAIKHLLESNFVEQGFEVWTKEHKDISLKDNSIYEFVQQVEYDPYSKLIQQVKD